MLCIALYTQPACRISLCRGKSKTVVGFVYFCGCARLWVWVCLFVVCVSMSVSHQHGWSGWFGLSCFSIDILWKNLSCPELLFSSFICLSYVGCCCCGCSGWCGLHSVLCVLMCVSDCVCLCWFYIVRMRVCECENNWNSTTCVWSDLNCRWIRFVSLKKHSSVALMVAMETKFYDRLLEN